MLCCKRVWVGLVVAAVFIVLSTSMASGQAIAPAVAAALPEQGTVKAKPITFEVASVRRDKTGAYGGNGPTADGYDQKGMPPVFFIGLAFGVMEFRRIEGLPGWCQFGGEIYDIDARVGEADVPEWRKSDQKQIQGALQALLAERFQLRAHFETRDAPVYALVVAKGGPKFKAAVAGDLYAEGIHDRRGKPNHGLGDKSEPGSSEPVSSEPRSSEPGSDRRRLIGQAATMAELAQHLSSLMAATVGRQVVDRTGMTGQYDFSMPVFAEWMGSHQNEDTEASIFTTLVDSLGLRLEPAKAPMQVLVIDHIERPSEN